MAIVMNNTAKATLLDQERAYLNLCKIQLYTSNTTPTGASVIGDFTLLTATDSPTGGRALNFGTPTTSGSDGVMAAPTETWTMTAGAVGLTIYGYVVFHPTGPTLIYAERAPAPVLISAAGQTYSVTPRKLMADY